VSTYREVIDAIEGLVSQLTPAERRAVMGGTAARVYGMRVGPDAGFSNDQSDGVRKG
jgi:hypothetical protein